MSGLAALCLVLTVALVFVCWRYVDLVRLYEQRRERLEELCGSREPGHDWSLHRHNPVLRHCRTCWRTEVDPARRSRWRMEP